MSGIPMSAETEDDFVDRLAALDEALADGQTPTAFNGDSVPDDMHHRLKRGLAALQALRHAKSDDDLPTVHAHDSPTLGATRSSAAPLHFGRFHVIRELGRGGFGIVFLARDPKLHRDVALKVPHAQAVMDSAMRERFRREAQAAAGLDHPNIVAVFEVDEQGPICALVSAYFPSVTLTEWLLRQSAPVEAKTAAKLVAELAAAVAFAHDHGVLHRDLKPANILIGQNETPKITDFGLAKHTDDVDRMTRTGAVVGTPAYMAPEQARGQHALVDVRADVYSLGAVLYEILVNRPPFRGESDVDTLRLVCETEPVAPRQFRPKLPRDLETICLKCLEKDPRRRYATAAELHADLDRYLNNTPVLARPVSQFERAARWCRRHPAISSLSLALIIAVTVGTTGMAMAYNQANIERQFAINEKQRADEERDAAADARDRNGRLFDKARGSIQELIDKGHQLVHAPGTVREGMEMLEVGRRYYTNLLRENPKDQPLRQQAVLICKRLGMLYDERQENAPAELAWQEAATHAQLLIDGPNGSNFHKEYFDLFHAWAESLCVRSNFEAAIAATEQPLTVGRAVCAAQPDDSQAAWHLHGILFFRGMAARQMKNWVLADETLREGLEVVSRFADQYPMYQGYTSQTNYLNHLSLSYTYQNRLPEAVDAAKRSVAVVRPQYEQNRQNVIIQRAMAGALHHLGRAEYNSRNWQACVDAFRESNKLFIDHWNDNVNEPLMYLLVAIAAKCTASALDFLEKPEDAIPDLRSVVELQAPAFRPGRNNPLIPDIFECYARLAALHLNQGDVAEARRLHAEAMAKLALVTEKTQTFAKPERLLDGVAAQLAEKAKP